MQRLQSLSLAARGVVDSIGRDLQWDVDASAVAAEAWRATNVSNCSPSEGANALANGARLPIPAFMSYKPRNNKCLKMCAILTCNLFIYAESARRR